MEGAFFAESYAFLLLCESMNSNLCIFYNRLCVIKKITPVKAPRLVAQLSIENGDLDHAVPTTESS